MLVSGGRPISGYVRRGTIDGQLAYIAVYPHTRTANPRPPTKKAPIVDPKKYKRAPNCKLPPPWKAKGPPLTRKPPTPALTRKVEWVD